MVRKRHLNRNHNRRQTLWKKVGGIHFCILIRPNFGGKKQTKLLCFHRAAFSNTSNRVALIWLYVAQLSHEMTFNTFRYVMNQDFKLDYLNSSLSHKCSPLFFFFLSNFNHVILNTNRAWESWADHHGGCHFNREWDAEEGETGMQKSSSRRRRRRRERARDAQGSATVTTWEAGRKINTRALPVIFLHGDRINILLG